MSDAVQNNHAVALIAGTICWLAVLGHVALSRSPVPLAFFGLLMLWLGLHAASLSAKLRRGLILVGGASSLGCVALVAARFA